MKNKDQQVEAYNENLLLHAVLNQLETDFNDQDYDSIDEMLTHLIFLEPARKVLIEYLSDSAKENWIEGKTITRY